MRMRMSRFFALSCSLALVGGSARAALLTLNPQVGAPDLFASLVNVSYTASDKTFTAVGFSDTYYPSWGNGSPATALGAGSWKLTANLGADNGITGGHLNVYNNFGDESPGDLLLSGNLVTGAAGQVFGFSNVGAANHDEFDFLFQVQGGSLANDYLAWGNIGAIILNADFSSGGTPFTGDWSQNFSNAGSGDSQTFVPEPAQYGFAVTVVAFLGAGVAQFKRLRFCVVS